MLARRSSARAAEDGSRDDVGIGRQRDGRLSVGMALQAGRTSGTSLRWPADLAEEYGAGVPHHPIRKRSSSTSRQHGSRTWSASWTGTVSPCGRARCQPSTMACTGIRYWKLAIRRTKSRANELVADLDVGCRLQRDGRHRPQRMPDSCARFQVADIGLKGSIVGAAKASSSPGRPPRPAVVARAQTPRPQGDRRGVTWLCGGPDPSLREPARGGRDLRGLGASADESVCRAAKSQADAMTERLVPFYCPYCGEESLEPVGERGEWHCKDWRPLSSTLRSGVRQPATDATRASIPTTPLPPAARR